MPDIYASIEAEDWVRRHVKDRGGDIHFYQWDGGSYLIAEVGGVTYRATSHYGDEWSAWQTVANWMQADMPEDDPSEIGDY